MVEVTRTVVKSPPEIWRVLDDEDLLKRWMAELLDLTDPVEIAIRAREPERRLSWQPHGLSRVREALIDVTMRERGWGTHLRVSAHVPPGGLFSGRRSQQARQRVEALVARDLADRAAARPHPFSRV